MIQKTLALLLLAAASSASDWRSYGGNSAGTRYSPLNQINRSNVARLQLAWTWKASEGRGDGQTQPIVINGVLFGITPKHNVIALDAATGKLLWRFDSGIAGRGPNRGLTYWTGGKGGRIFAAVQSYVYALDASTGKPIASFGDAGRIDLRRDLGRDPANQSIDLTTPGIVFDDLLIVGGRTPEALPAPPGDIRAYDVRTGKLRWSFHTIPHPGEYGYETWPKDAWTYSGAANNWAGMAVDEKRGIVYVPTGSAASDFYGFDRLGDNLFANTLLALDARTGKRIWHFQGVKHDIWDRDFPSPPVLVTVKRGGKRIDAVAQPTKQGWLYLFNRVDGTPLFPIAQRSYPASTTPGEVASTTQPLPTRPEPFARQALTEDLLTTRTPEAHQWALNRFRTLASGGQFVPFHVDQDTVIFPGFDGGAEWGGSAFDPETGLLYVNANDLPWTSSLAENTRGNSGRQLYLRNCANCHRDNMAGAPPQMPSLVNIQSKRTREEIIGIIRQGAGRMPGFPGLQPPDVQALVQYVLSGESRELEPNATPGLIPKYRFTGYHKFLDPDGYPAVIPPWGTLNAINLNTGGYAWKIPLGEYPELAGATGTENYGGPIVTAGGLVFIAATNFDRKFRAFEKLTGKLLWETTLPMSGNATPITYEVNGRQYVVIYATGGKGRPTDPSGGVYMAFSLPETRERHIAVISHRGEHLSHPENTLAAFQAAIDLGADYFELDVRTTQDGKLVLMHDGTVDRTTKGKGEVANMTFDEIRALGVPTFDEALSLAEGRIGVYVDCKRISPRDVVDALERHHMLEHSVIYGGWDFLKQVSALQPAARVMPEANNPDHMKQIFAEGHPPVIAFDARDFTAENIAIVKAAKALIYVDRLGPSDNQAAWEDAIRRGADGIQTDHPGELVEFLKHAPLQRIP